MSFKLFIDLDFLGPETFLSIQAFDISREVYKYFIFSIC